MRYILVLLAIGMVTALQARESSSSIDEFITAEMPAAGAPGLAYAAVENGEIYSHTYGEILSGSGRKITPETPFLLGSISKSFTAMAVMKLVDAGKIELDSGISHYLDVFAGRPGGDVTIRQLLSHTSGYSTLQGNETHKDRTDSGDELFRQVERIAQGTPAHEPGTHWQYSNANYLILGALIEEISGQDYARFIETEILVPIGMEHSFVADGEVHEEMAVGHQPWFRTKRPLKDMRTSRLMAPAGGVIATAPDLALYLAIMINGQDDIISAESKSLILRPASDASPFYGFGWYVDTSNGTAYHGGLSPGVETLATLSPEEGKGVVVLINSNSGMGFGVNTNLLYGISAKALGQEFTGGGGDWGTKSLFLTFALLPIIFITSSIWAGTHGEGLRSKSGAFGAFSLWFPLVMTLLLAWTSVCLLPKLFGVPLKTLDLYQPDFVLMLIATAVTGVFWAVLRLGIAYKPGRV